MPLFKFGEHELTAVKRRSMAELNIRERTDLQRLLRDSIEVISPGTLVVSEEYTGWVGSLRRIDLLGIDRDGTLVVFELKRTEDGGHMDLQGVRYAAMASLLSFKELVAVFTAHLEKAGRDGDAEALLRDHLDVEAEDCEAVVAAKVRIVLASPDFGQELTTTVLWLNQHGLDIRCIRMVPYEDGESVYLDVQQIIPVPEAADYVLKLREKEERKEVARQGDRDFTRFIVDHAGNRTAALPKRRAMLAIVKILVGQGHAPEDLQVVMRMNRFIKAAGHWRTKEEFARAPMLSVRDGNPGNFDLDRFFTAESELIHHGGNTYVFSHQWGSKTREIMKSLLDRYSNAGIKVEETS